MNNYDRAKDSARQLFLRWDQDALIKRLMLDADVGEMRLSFLGEPFAIHRATGAVENRAQNRVANFSEALTIYDYLCREGRLPLASQRLCAINGLKHVAQSSPNDVLLHQRHALRFQEDVPALRRALERIGTFPFAQGDAACVFPVFDGLSAVFQFWEGDDEFPPSIRFLWCENMLDFLKYETVYYVMGCFLDRLHQIMA